jgi:hypothetical protein
MTDTEDRLLDMVDDELKARHPVFSQEWALDRAALAFRVQSPVEPCEKCGHRVYLILPHGSDQPRWARIGEPQGLDTLFPSVRQVRHECGDGESWSVEAALFVETAMAEWGLTPGARAGGGAR